MSATVRQTGGVVTWLFPKRRTVPPPTSGSDEFAVAWHCCQLMEELPLSSRARILTHMSEIFEEQEKRIEAVANERLI